MSQEEVIQVLKENPERRWSSVDIRLRLQEQGKEIGMSSVQCALKRLRKTTWIEHDVSDTSNLKRVYRVTKEAMRHG